MNSIADSSAVSLPQKMLTQHHTAIAFLSRTLPDHPKTDGFDWLDLACGRGQIVNNLEETITDAEMRARIRYWGYDISNDHMRDAEKVAKTMGFGAITTIIGSLSDFPKLVKADQKYSFITFTNAVHELPPVLFGSLLLELILRMKKNATLYIFDMETLPELELGAVTWEINDVRALLAFIYEKLGAKTAPPMVQFSRHSSCTAWTVNFEREKLDVNGELFEKQLPELFTPTTEFIQNMFLKKLERNMEELEALTQYGGETAEEQKRKIKLLFDFWSMSRLNTKTS